MSLDATYSLEEFGQWVSCDFSMELRSCVEDIEQFSNQHCNLSGIVNDSLLNGCTMRVVGDIQNCGSQAIVTLVSKGSKVVP